MHRTTRTLGVLAALALAAGGCSTDEAGAAPASGTITVHALDFGYADLPETVEAGATVRLVNDSDTELHELVAIRLPDDEERPAEELVQLPPDQLAAFFPLVQTVVLAEPGSDEQIPAVGDGTLTEPGRYLVLCAIPTGADPGEYLAAAAASEGGPPEVEGGPPHLAHGMWAELEVVAP
jgi:uncharacterized cupredoxin-like copper-binding protein